MRASRTPRGGGFTLVELLVVIAIIGLVSAATLPAILPAINHRQVSDAARTLQAILTGARDSASRADSPRGIRFLRDKALADAFPSAPAPGNPNNVLAFSSMIDIALPPDYSEGTVDLLLGTGSLLMVFGHQDDPASTPALTLPGTPTNWYWNIRKGDKIRIGNIGPYYTIVGPMAIPIGATNPEGYINQGLPGTALTGPGPTTTLGTAEVLMLANGLDANNNGFIDDMYDGIDNDGNGFADNNLVGGQPTAYPGGPGPPVLFPGIPPFPYPNDPNEHEPEVAESPLNNLAGAPHYFAYSITRRAAVRQGAKVTTLPSDVVIDATEFNSASPPRSRLPLDPNATVASGALDSFDILFAPNGQFVPSSPYAGTASPQSFPTTPFFHFWLTEREGINEPPVPAGGGKGQRRLVTLSAKSGMILVKDNETGGNTVYIDAQNGVRDQQ